MGQRVGVRLILAALGLVCLALTASAHSGAVSHDGAWQIVTAAPGRHAEESEQPAAGQAALFGPQRLWLPLVLRKVITPWYKLRLDVVTTSDWSVVEMAGGAHVAVSGVVAAEGGWQRKVESRGIALNQSAAAALSGGQVSASVEFALTGLGSTVNWVITRGGWGYTHVTLWNANGLQPVKVAEAHWSGSNPPDRYTFSVSAGDIMRGGPLLRGWSAIVDAEFELQRRMDVALPGPGLLFQRTRVTLTTTSDWASLYVLRGAELGGARLVDTTGGPTYAAADAYGLLLRQPLDRAMAGAQVGLFADVLLHNVAAGGVQFLLVKGGLNQATAEVYNANGPAPVWVQRATQTQPSPDPLTFTVRSDLLSAGGPLPLRKPATSKLVWAFYYLWYSDASWQDPILQDHPLLPYASSDVTALARHIDQARAAGIDGFAASWWGPGDYTDANWARFLDLAGQRGFWVMPYFETLGASSLPRPEAEIKAWLDYLLRTYRSHPAWYKLDGKPVIIVWASGTVPLHTWQSIFADLRTRGLDAVYVAMGLGDASVLSVFDGQHEYGVFTVFRLGQTYEAVETAVRAYSVLHPSRPAALYVATLQPGYDERTIPGRAGAYWERRNGDAYRYTFEAASKSNPDWLFITSWNEWWENTHIEPSVRYGDLYLRLTREFSDAWKGR